MFERQTAFSFYFLEDKYCSSRFPIELYNSKMRDYTSTQMIASVKCQFVRRCSNSQKILSRLADDLIGRYSAKTNPHPQFFKQDIAMAHNQLTIYADQCIQAMRKFQFLQVGADVITSITNATLRIIDFLAKQVYYRFKDKPNITGYVEEPLCNACSRLRQNQRLRSLRQQLDINRIEPLWDDARPIRELVVRRGQKYDQEQLLYEQLDSLQALNEDQIRRRLGKMELDHDKRKKDIVIAIQELNRASQRVVSYGRSLQRSGKEFSGKFDVKNYIFQMGRHFYHNIASLDTKIRQLKQSLSPTQNSQCQTDQIMISQVEYNETIQSMIKQFSIIKSNLEQTSKSLIISEKKVSEYSQIIDLLQQRIKQIEQQREQQKIQQKIAYSQLRNNYDISLNKIESLQAIVRKNKKIKTKNFEKFDQKLSKEESVRSQLVPIYDDLNLQLDKRHHTCSPTSSKNFWRESILNPRFILRLSGIRTKDLDEIMELPSSTKDIIKQIIKEQAAKMRIVRVLQQSFCLKSNKYKQDIVSRIRQGKYSQRKNQQLNQQNTNIQTNKKIIEAQKLFENEKNNYRDKKKLSRIQVGKFEFTKLKNKESIHAVEQISAHRQSATVNISKTHLAFDDIRNSIQEKTNGHKKTLKSLKSSLGLPTFSKISYHEKQDKQLLRKNIFEKMLPTKTKKYKKNRNLSQQNSYQMDPKEKQLRRSIQKMQYKQKNLFSDKQKQLLLSTQGDPKMVFKNILFKAQSVRIILSLEEINFSTYFYSIIAGIHVKTPSIYEQIRRFFGSLVSELSDEQNNIKEGLNCILVAHRKCNPGNICHHLESFLKRVKDL